MQEQQISPDQRKQILVEELDTLIRGLDKVMKQDDREPPLMAHIVLTSLRECTWKGR